ncbi:MAG: tetratricopeptide repeat protein [Planctomycetes bacterium]|nr:tetratricopeptide repeat protein [Planctomycetota bacterium]MBM4083705.1 tetratricopeptide repeat protein [Planctomycetota bacterium]
MPSRSTQHRTLLLVALVAALPYANALRGTFLYDDIKNVVRNPHIRTLGNLPLFFTSNVAADDTRDSYRPFRATSFALDYAVWGLNPLGFHLTNVLLHAANPCLAFSLVRKLLGSSAAGFLAALLFATHPAQTESVTWVNSRGDVLFAFFFLVSCLLFLWSDASRRPLQTSRQRWLYASSVAGYGFSLLAKEMAAPLPFILGLHVLCFGASGVAARFDRAAKLAVPYLGMAALYALARWAVCGQISHAADLHDRHIGLSNALLMLCEMLGRYGVSILLPVHLGIAHLVQSANIVSTRLHVLGALFALIALATAAWALRRNRTLFFALGWFFIALLPVSNILPIKILFAERFLYVPLLAWPLGLAALLVEHHTRRLGIVALLLLLVGCASALTAERNHVWRTSETLWYDAARKSPGNPVVHHSLGHQYRDRGHTVRAARSFERALSASPDDWVVLHSLALAYGQLGHTDRAVSMLKQVIALNPDFGLAHLNLGQFRLRAGQVDEALRELELASKLEPNMHEAFFSLGRAYERQGRREDALRAYRQSLVLEPVANPALNALERLVRTP